MLSIQLELRNSTSAPKRERKTDRPTENYSTTLAQCMPCISVIEWKPIENG